MSETTRGLLETRLLPCGCYVDAAEGEIVALHRECDEAKRLRSVVWAANHEIWRRWSAGEWPRMSDPPAEVLEPYRELERTYRAHFEEPVR